MKQLNSSRSEAAKRRRHRVQEEEENRWEYHHLSSSSERSLQTNASNTSENAVIEVPSKSYQVYDINSQTDSRGSILVAMYSNTNAKRTSTLPTHNTEGESVIEDAWTRPTTNQTTNSEISIVRRTTLVDSSPSNVQSTKISDRSFHSNDQRNHEENTTVFSSPSFASGSSSILQFKYDAQQDRNVTKT